MDDLVVNDGGGGKRTRRYSEDFVHPLNFESLYEAAGSSGNAATNANPQTAAASPLALARKVSGGLSPVISSAASVNSTSTISEAVHMEIRGLNFGGHASANSMNGATALEGVQNGVMLVRVGSGSLSASGNQLCVQQQQSLPLGYSQQHQLDLQQASPRSNQSGYVWIRSSSGTFVTQQIPNSARLERTLTGSSQGGEYSTSESMPTQELRGQWAVLGPYFDTDTISGTNGGYTGGSMSQRDDQSSAVSVVGSESTDSQHPSNTQHSQYSQTQPQSLQHYQPVQLPYQATFPQMQLQGQQSPMHSSQDYNGRNPSVSYYSQQDSQSNSREQLRQQQQHQQQQMQPQQQQQQQQQLQQKRYLEDSQAQGQGSPSHAALPNDMSRIIRPDREKHLSAGLLNTTMMLFERTNQDFSNHNLTAEAQALAVRGAAATQRSFFESQQAQKDAPVNPLPEDLVLIPKAKVKTLRDDLKRHLEQQQRLAQKHELVAQANQRWGVNISANNNTANNTSGGAANQDNNTAASVYSRPTSKPGLIPANSTPALGGCAGSAWYAPLYPKGETRTDSKPADSELPPGAIHAYRIRLYGHRPEIAYEPITLLPGQPYDPSTVVLAPPNTGAPVTQPIIASHGPKGSKGQLLAQQHQLQSTMTAGEGLGDRRGDTGRTMREVVERFNREGKLLAARQQISDQATQRAASPTDVEGYRVTRPAAIVFGGNQHSPSMSGYPSPGEASPPGDMNSGISSLSENKQSCAPDVNDGASVGVLASPGTSAYPTPQFAPIPPPMPTQLPPPPPKSSRRRSAAAQDTNSADQGDATPVAKPYIPPSMSGGVPHPIRKDGLTLQLDALTALLNELGIQNDKMNAPKLVQLATVTISSLSKKLHQIEAELAKKTEEVNDIGKRHRELERALIDAVSGSSNTRSDRDRLQVELEKKAAENEYLQGVISAKDAEIERLTRLLSQSRDPSGAIRVHDEGGRVNSADQREPLSAQATTTIAAGVATPDDRLAESKFDMTSGGPMYDTMSVSSSVASHSQTKPQKATAPIAGSIAITLDQLSEAEPGENHESHRIDTLTLTNVPSISGGSVSLQNMGTKQERGSQLRLQSQLSAPTIAGVNISEDTNVNETEADYFSTGALPATGIVPNPLAISPTPGSLAQPGQDISRRRTLMGVQSQPAREGAMSVETGQLTHSSRSMLDFEGAPQTPALAAARARFARRGSALGTSSSHNAATISSAVGANE